MATILGHDLSDSEFWAEPWSVREEVFRTLRVEQPVVSGPPSPSAPTSSTESNTSP